MRASTMLAHAPLDDRLRKLRAALRKLYLTPADRPIVRRNARRRVLSALRSLRGTLDEYFPPIVERAEPRKRKTGEARVKQLEKEGWVQQGSITVARYAALGVPVKIVRWATKEVKYDRPIYVMRKGWVQSTTAEKTEHEVLLIPGWATAIGFDNPSELRAAKRSVTVRKAALVAEALR